jgi:hypothetical protein
MVAKKWEERLPLSDLRGLQLFGAALYHAAKFHENRVRGTYERFERERLEELCPFYKNEIGDSESRSELIYLHLMALDTSDETLELGKALTAQDIRFSASELYRHQEIIYFLREPRSAFSPDCDRDTPISCNTDLAGERYLVALFLEAFADFCQPGLRQDYFPRTQQESVFMELVADLCEEPRGRGAPKGRRYEDSAHDAANHAWDLRYRDPKINRAEAVRRSLECFEIVPTEPVKPGDSMIVAISYDAAFKRVYEKLALLEVDEPPIKTREHSNYLSPFDD